jgi:hypothetical protein
MDQSPPSVAAQEHRGQREAAATTMKLAAKPNTASPLWRRGRLNGGSLPVVSMC